MYEYLRTTSSDAPHSTFAWAKSRSPKSHSLIELLGKDSYRRWRCLRTMKVPVSSPRDPSPKTDESELFFSVVTIDIVEMT